MKGFIKFCLIYILRFLMRFLYVFPIKKNRVIFHSYKGTQYSCSPKYITEYLIKNNSNEYEIIWAFRSPNQFKNLESKGIKLVKYFSIKRFYIEATAKFSINNIGSFSWLPTRKNQYHINTWHGGGCYKNVSLSESKNNFFEKRNLLLTAHETNLYLSSSGFFSENIIKKDFGYKGEILNCGLPRNDIFFQKNKESIKEKILKELSINSNAFIILYAPTWRYDTYEEIEHIDFDSIKEQVERDGGRECVILCRTHHLSNVHWFDNTYNVTKYPDMQELLLISDLLITDYSSCMWDFSIQSNPIFLYTPDLKKYLHTRGFVVNIHDWGFPICENNLDLQDNISSYLNSNLSINSKNHQKMLVSYESGKACEQLLNWMIHRR